MTLNRRYLLSALAPACWSLSSSYAADRWNVSAEQPDGTYITAVAREFAADVGKATNGQLEIKIHSNSVLFKRPDLKRAVQTGQVQVGDVLLSVLGDEDKIQEDDPQQL